MNREKPIQTGEIIQVKCPFGKKTTPFYWCATTGYWGTSTTTGVVSPCPICGGTGVLTVETFAEGEHIPEDADFEKYCRKHGRPDWKALPSWPRLGPVGPDGRHTILEKDEQRQGA